MDVKEPVKLTGYSRGSGCGCKISPAVLQEMLGTETETGHFPQLLSSHKNNDDAAAWELEDGSVLLSTTDFFMPIVDDAFDFGRIAAANAISDVYAMGGSPLMAIAILGWPIDKLPVSLAGEVMRGARHICKEAGIPLAGGHTIDAVEPFFGLSVNGRVKKQELLLNSTAEAGDLLFLTKPIGSGIFSTAQKRGLLQDQHQSAWINNLTSLNKAGDGIAGKVKISALTDVTGFGLLGHVFEMATAANLTAELHYNKIPLLNGLQEYLSKKTIPDATFRNWNSYSAHTAFDKGVNVMEAFNVLPDPQTNGGLLIACKPEYVAKLQQLLTDNNVSFLQPVGEMKPAGEKRIFVKNV